MLQYPIPASLSLALLCGLKKRTDAARSNICLRQLFDGASSSYLEGACRCLILKMEISDSLGRLRHRTRFDRVIHNGSVAQLVRLSVFSLCTRCKEVRSHRLPSKINLFDNTALLVSHPVVFSLLASAGSYSYVLARFFERALPV